MYNLKQSIKEKIMHHIIAMGLGDHKSFLVKSDLINDFFAEVSDHIGYNIAFPEIIPATDLPETINLTNGDVLVRCADEYSAEIAFGLLRKAKLSNGYLYKKEELFDEYGDIKNGSFDLYTYDANSKEQVKFLESILDEELTLLNDEVMSFIKSEVSKNDFHEDSDIMKLYRGGLKASRSRGNYVATIEYR